MTLYKWSQTAASDATADSTINWSEGQPPSSVNDSARAMMAATAKYRDDIAGAIITGGTSTAYTVSSYQVFDSLAHLGGQMIAFTPHITNGAGPVTLNLDSLGPKPLRTAPIVELQSGVLIQGTPYVALYNNLDGAFYLRGVGPAPGIPLGAGMDYWGSTAPSSAFAFPAGQSISRTTYSSLFSVFGTIYGIGDGLTTFNLPDLRGRVVAAMDAMGGTAAGRLSNIASSLGANGGEQAHTLLSAEMPVHSHAVTDPGHTHNISGINQWLQNNGSGSLHQGTATGSDYANLTLNSSTTGISLQNTGGGAGHNNIQPTIVCNYVLRVL